MSEILELLFEESLKKGGLDHDEILRDLSIKGWDRLKFFNECNKLFLTNSFTEAEIDNLAEFFNDLIGNCLVHLMVKLPNEPQDNKEFYNYIKNEQWKK